MKNLTLEEREFLIEQLAKGSSIPDDFKEKLFPTTQKEYELRYAGKMRKEDLLADQDGTFAVPLQVEKIYNGKREVFADGWRNMLVFGDNLQFLKTIYKNEDPLIKDKVKGKVKLIYIDPPFATEGDFNTQSGQKAYTDKAKGSEFIEFIRKRLIVAQELLHEKGFICVHLDQKKGHYIKMIMDEIFGENNFVNEMIWSYRSGGASKKVSLPRKHDNILVYRKSESATVNAKTERQYLSKQFMDTKVDENGNFYSDTILRDVFEGLINVFDKDKIRVYNTRPVLNLSTERIDYPTQKPEGLLSLIIEIFSNEGDLVMDFFGGSGTTCATAEKLNRRWINCDIGKYSFYTFQKRLLKIEKTKDLINSENKYKKQAKTFITVNTGIYDLAKMQELNQDKYIEFVLQLFEVTPKKSTKKGFTFHGERKDGYPVIVWDYLNSKNSNLDIFFLENLHQTLGKSVSKRVYIIAPANAVDFISDFYEIDDVRYYFLKIPYQIIKELHPKNFAKIRQPQSKTKVNDLENAIGFHFSLQPDVESSFENDNIIITKFSSNFREEDTNKTLQNFESLSMVVIDDNFNGDDFMMSHCIFRDDILEGENNLQIPLEKYGEKICVIFIDIYGNEFKQILKTN